MKEDEAFTQFIRLAHRMIHHVIILLGLKQMDVFITMVCLANHFYLQWVNNERVWRNENLSVNNCYSITYGFCLLRSGMCAYCSCA